MLDPERQRAFAVEVVTRLRDAGHVALWAGGCVRDHLLGRRPKDYDVATSARPEQIREVFSRRRTLEVGAAFGVVAVVGPKPAGIVEVVTFRRDVDYLDGRRPERVEFSTAEEDAARRDFTINGLFYDPLADRVHDYVGGLSDLERGVVRAIGEARARFQEDKLRLLRAVRMAATFDFTIERDTEAALREMAPQVTLVSAERIAQELRLMLVLRSRRRAAELLESTGLLEAIAPELAPLAEMSVEGKGNLWRHTLDVLERLENPEFPLALATLAHEAGHLADGDAAKDNEGSAAAQGAAIVAKIARRWRLSRKEEERAAWIVRHQSALRGVRDAKWSQVQPLLIAEGAADLVDFHAAEARALGRPLDDVAFCRERLGMPHDELDPPPLLNGDDLIAHQVPSGALIGQILARVRAAQLDREIGDRHEALALADRLTAQRNQLGG